MKYGLLHKIRAMIIILLLCSISILSAAIGPSTAVSAATLNNIALCYHGIVTNASEKSEYMSYIEDFKGQINYIISKGYTFVSPTKFNEWYVNKYVPATPIATIIFDDARGSIDVAARWLINNQIPFGVAVIGSKLGTAEPQDGYISWSTLKSLYDTGYCEILSHSYNMHHFDLRNENSTIVSAPILEGPCYIDSGEFVYIDATDSRWYWDLSHIDNTAWAFPLFGTDTAAGTPITSTIKFKAKGTVTVNKIRVWACLHLPNSTGYNANVKIDINGTQVANKAINVQQYTNRSQWPEREFVTIDLDQTYAIEAGNTYTITFTTQNPGSSTFRIYAIPDFTGDYGLSTTCTGMTYGAAVNWPAKACIILSGEGGREATDAEFQQYVYNDLNMNKSVINKYLTASWNTASTGYVDDGNLECITLGGTYSDGSTANTAIKFTPAASFTGEVLRFKYATHMGGWYPLIMDVYVNDQKVARFSSNWNDWSWQTVDISPYQFVQGQEYNITFKTLNQSPSGLGLVRILADQQDLPWPTWNTEIGGFTPPPESQFQVPVQFQVSALEGTDVFPAGVNIVGQDYSWIYNAPYTGPGKAFLEVLSCIPGQNVPQTQICYPFGSYYLKQLLTKEDVDPVLKDVLIQISMDSGYAVWDEGMVSMVDVQSNYSEFVIPRYLVEGNLDQSQILQNIDTLIGLQ